MQFLFMQGMNPPFSGHFNQPSWLIIDTGHTFNSICNHQLLSSVRSYSTIQLLSNGEILECTQFGLLDLLPNFEGHYNQHFIANLLSVSVVTPK